MVGIMIWSEESMLCRVKIWVKTPVTLLEPAEISVVREIKNGKWRTIMCRIVAQKPTAVRGYNSTQEFLSSNYCLSKKDSGNCVGADL